MMNAQILINRIFDIPLIYPVYFFYGAAFLFLGISILVKDQKGSELKIANSLWMLGAFGLVHGTHEWLELFRLAQRDHLALQELYLLKFFILHLFVLSFFFLLQFGLSLLRALDVGPLKWLKTLPALLAISWLTFLWMHLEGTDPAFLWNTELGVRRTLGVAGMLLTAYGLIQYAREIRLLSRSVAQYFHYAGLAFIAYGTLGGLLAFHPIFHQQHLLLPSLRGLTAVVIAYFIIRALNIFNLEMRMKIEQQSRLLVQAEKLTSLGKLAAGIAHEINNPLTNASLRVQMLKEQLKTECAETSVLEKLGALEKNIERASAIAQELLQFSRQNGHEFSPVDINAVIHSAVSLLEFQLHNITLEKQLAPIPELMGDKGKLEQAFINILSNALEAMPQGGSMSISSVLKDEMLEIRVADTGEGIAEENLPRIFEPFFTTKEVGAGTGLGLFISYGIIKQHGGNLEVASTIGKGTTVTITLPAKERYEKNFSRG